MKPAKQSCLGATGNVGLVLLIILVIPILLELILWTMGGFLVVADPLKPVDAIVALSGSGDQTRLEEAARLYKAKYARWFIITDTGAMLPNDKTPYSAVLKKIVVELGVPEKFIIITATEVSSTWGEARTVRKLLLAKGLKSCIVVTDPYHTLRTRLVFRDEFSAHLLSVTVHPVPGTTYHTASWWLNEESRVDTFSEYAKLAAYLLGMKQD